RVVWFEGCGSFEIGAAAGVFPAAQAYQAPSQPGVAQGGIQTDGFLESGCGFGPSAARGGDESFEGPSLGVARGQSQSALQSIFHSSRMAETEFQFRHARPGETEVRRFGGGGSGRSKGRFEVELSLLLVRAG